MRKGIFYNNRKLSWRLLCLALGLALVFSLMPSLAATLWVEPGTYQEAFPDAAFRQVVLGIVNAGGEAKKKTASKKK